MVKVEVVGLKEYLAGVVEVLQDLGSLHPEEMAIEGTTLRKLSFSDTEAEERRTLEQSENALLEIAAHVPASAQKALGPFLQETREQLKRDYKAVREEAARLVEQARALLRRRSQLSEELAILSRYQKVLHELLPIVKGGRFPEGYDLVGLTIESTQKEVLGALRKALGNATEGRFALLSRQVGEDRTVAVVAYDLRYEKQVAGLINRENVRELSLPAELEGKPLDESLDLIARRVAAIPEEIRRTNEQLSSFVREHGARVLGMERAVADRLSQLRFRASIVQTDHLFLLHGWLPADDVEKAQDLLRSRSQEGAILHELYKEEVEHTEVPVKIQNPKVFKPFELLLSIFPAPAYGSIDPTILMAIGFPIFYGLMLGDSGYGLCVLGLGIFLGLRWGHSSLLRQAAYIIGVCGAWGIIFGLLFGEFFGFTNEPEKHIAWVPGVLTGRGGIAATLLGVTVLIGLLHVLLGLLLGVRNAAREHNWHHIVEKLGMLCALAGFTLLGLYVLKYVADRGVALASGALLGLAVVLLGVGAGLSGVVEITSVLTHVLSYTRLMAFGLASLIIAEIANEVGRGGSIWVPVAVLIHLLNIVLGIYAPMLQGLRLHYVEFLPKFYAFGGRDYIPFKRKGD